MGFLGPRIVNRYLLIASISNYIRVAREFIVDEESFRLRYGGIIRTGYSEVGITKGFINKSSSRSEKSLQGRQALYCTDWIITTPTVKAIITPTIITLDASWVRRITAVNAEIPSIAAINAAGAITKGISLVNQISVCIFFSTRNDSMGTGRVLGQYIH